MVYCKILNTIWLYTFEKLKMRNRIQIYWLAQIVGWGLFVLGNILIAKMQMQEVKGLYVVSVCIFIIGILITHFFRYLIHRLGLKKMNILVLILITIPSSLVLSFLFTSINTSINDAINAKPILLESFGNRNF